MDLELYEHLKFDIAEIVRSGQLLATEQENDPRRKHDTEQLWRGLLARLADDRFTVVFAGRFNRGKSSLMNALLGLDRPPTGIVPLTSVITYVRYGTSERVLLDYQDSRLRGEASLQQLPELVTEKGNPGNVKRLRSAEIQLPAEILRRGVFLVDTPGLGSAIFENTKTTESFIPEIDVLVLVTSYESPLTDDEIRYLQQASVFVGAIFIVVNKQDTVVTEARAEVLEYINATAQRALDGAVPKPFSISAREGLLAKQATNEEALKASGVRQFESELLNFLTAHRSELFLLKTCDRVLVHLESLPGSAEATNLISKLKEIRREISASGEQQNPSFFASRAPRTELDARGVTPCAICRAVLSDVLGFLRQYQYDLSTSPRTQEEHAQRGGFCSQHTWHYEQIASPRGVCIAYPRLLSRSASLLRSLAENHDGRPYTVLDHDCPACKVRSKTEQRIVRSLTAKALDTSETSQIPALCLPHLGMVCTRIDNPDVRRELLIREAAILERTAEDMQRYAIKHDALRRYLASKEENDAPLLGLQLLVGHRNVNSIFTVRDIL